MTKERQGAIAAMVCALCFIIGLAVVLLIVPDFNQNAEQRLVVFMKHKLLMQVWYFVVYVVFGVSLLALSRSLLAQRTGEHSFLEQMSSLVSYLWACYILACGLIAILSIEFIFTNNSNGTNNISEAWRQIYNVQMGLGEGVEWVGAIWVIFMNSCLHYQNRFPKSLIIMGFIIAAIGMLTLYPPLAEIGAIFGLLQIFWFLAISILLLRKDTQNI
ncbi:hypothetical protein Q4493_14760 [Colwellia sp. 1_MG-2023]|uniref:hypothetical protein n=1 Tax=Colwellia sp. 1_MG-2023 TaxID=3062649 RepID=UPI0026E3F297|nr:hypothetical protein [Colwellia sp. 1_MG-2023]MDO6447029.1 hypothetical protein [Colwellia sp. 1_MG-2023]